MIERILMAARLLGGIAFLAALGVAAGAAEDTACAASREPVGPPSLSAFAAAQPEAYVECIEAEERLAAIQAFAGQWAQCYEAGDADCMAALYAPDAMLVSAEAAPIHGAAAIRGHYAARFAAAGGERVSLAYETVRAGAGEATAVLRWSAGARTARSLLILRDTDGAWRIWRQMDGAAPAG